ncbi:DUF6042 family protein [Kribbella monticola]|uniref:DUF6042 family protein n=1 Tax=Kribbella monticola TaxID=2185285 RepID=UPI000DD3A15D|nr:DUF6042 family protein [Kribbella monticola]
MTIVRQFENDHYTPEDGVLVVRDAGGGFGADERSAIDAHPCGTIVRTGQGWLYASGGDGPCVVRLRLQADRPADDDDWAELVEVPYGSLSGAVELSLLTTSSGLEQLRLGEPGLYRLRVAHRPLPRTVGPMPDMDDEEAEEHQEPTELWQLDFWQVREPAEPPQWIRRRRPAVRPLDPGWRSLLDFQVLEIPNVVLWAGGENGLTMDELRQWAIDHYRGDQWLDQPLSTYTTPGHPSLAEIAAQVGVPEPTIRRDVLPLAVALGLLRFEGTRYVGVERPRPAQEVLRLPAKLVEVLEATQLAQQYTGYAADLISVVLWSRPEQSVAELASRTLASEDHVRRALRYAERVGQARVEWVSDDEVILVPLKRDSRY